jgi:inosine-uridine nucleoside N-ribohydrolase
LAAVSVLGWAASVAMGHGQGGAAGGTSAPQLAILDTDIGDDIDDSFALALILRSPEVKLLGITTAFGDTELRARLVERYLVATGDVGIQVAAGIKTPANNVFTQAVYAKHGMNPNFDLCSLRLLSSSQLPVPKPEQDRYDACERDRHDGVGFMLRTIREHPGEITLIAIGPLANVGDAIQRDPETFKKLRRVVMMGGSVYAGYGKEADGKPRPPEPEWNIARDPAGAKALLASGVPVFMMPLDSTQVHLETAERERIFAFGSPLTDQLTLLYHQWIGNTDNHTPTPTLFDPVAAAYAVRPELCPAKPLRLEVDDKGSTTPVDGAPNAQVCLALDEKGFLDFLLGRIASQQASQDR